MPKGVIVLLVVIAVVFLLTLVVGASNRDDGRSPEEIAADPPSLVSGLDGGSRPLRIAGEVFTNCAVESETVVSFSGSCSIDVPSRGAFSRPVKAALSSAAGTVGVTFRPAEGETPPSETLSPGECVESAVDRNGGRFELGCAGGGTCVVELRQEGC